MNLESSLQLREGSFNRTNISEVEKFFNAPKDKRIYLLSSVRGISEVERKKIEEHIKNRKISGFKVYDPYKHTSQDDITLLKIFETHRAIIENSGIVDAVYNSTSAGSIADMGMTFMAQTPVNLVNQEYFKTNSSPNVAGLVMVKYGKHTLEPTILNNKISNTVYEILKDRQKQLKDIDQVEFAWNEKNPALMFDFGMIFAARKPFTLKDRENYSKSEDKSFLNLLLAVHDKYHMK